MESEERSSSSFVLIGNIPGRFHSSDLRSFFSHFTEKKGFLCFHFRHRPELLAAAESASIDDSSAHVQDAASKGSSAPRSCCCVAAVVKGTESELHRLYHDKHWAYPNGELLRARVRISDLVVSENDETAKTDSSPPESRFLQSTPRGIPWGELKALSELNPPSVMPCGNVGTPLATFMDLIRACKLPPRVIKKLHLEFPKTRSRTRYGAVGLDYGTGVTVGTSAVDSCVEVEGEGVTKDPLRTRLDSPGAEEEEEEPIPPDDDHDAEEWERYEALHDDVDKQERTKERLYEEEMEVVWDKGSSGLVFYTDASYWDQQDGDFDEKCSQEDDWDVDMAGYYGSGGDKDARDLEAMKLERRFREGKDPERIGVFEKYTTGIGSRLLKRSGWSEGVGVGALNQGISEPVEVEGQHARNKRGFGYRGEKLGSQDGPPPRKTRRPRATKDVIISTVYDRPDEEESTLYRTAPSRTIKYRESVKFQGGGVLKGENSTST